MLTEFWDMKGAMSLDFLENGATVNSASHWQIFEKICHIYSRMCVKKNKIKKTYSTHNLISQSN